jgi:hypothetical protein
LHGYTGDDDTKHSGVDINLACVSNIFLPVLWIYELEQIEEVLFLNTVFLISESFLA